MKQEKVHCTKNYSLFTVDSEQRGLEHEKRRDLKRSMLKYGYLKSFPISCVVRGGDLHIKDGQHRFYWAQQLGLPVYYIIEDVDYDIAAVNCTQRTWTPKDYATRYARIGNRDYEQLLEFAAEFRVTIPLAATLLSGYTSFRAVKAAFHAGQFRVRDRDWAERVASTYSAIRRLSRNASNALFLQAVMAACRIDGFDTGRLVRSAEKHVDKLKPVSTREAFLDVIEDIYNCRNRTKRLPVKFLALEAMQARNPAVAAKKR